MADAAPVVHIGENSPEEVAFKLLRLIAAVEGRKVPNLWNGDTKGDRTWILDTYAECIEAVKGFRSSTKPKRGSMVDHL